jgi:periplasmic copper chaperone A
VHTSGDPVTSRLPMAACQPAGAGGGGGGGTRAAQADSKAQPTIRTKSRSRARRDGRILLAAAKLAPSGPVEFDILFPVTRRSALLIGIALAALPFPKSAHAHDSTAGALTIHHPWARATPTGAKVGALYLTVSNSGAEGDRLLSVSTDAAEHCEIHASESGTGMMTMRMVEEVDIPAGDSISLAPQGTHVMLMGLKAPLKKGTTFPATLHFDKAGEVAIEVTVQGLADLQPAD